MKSEELTLNYRHMKAKGQLQKLNKQLFYETLY